MTLQKIGDELIMAAFHSATDDVKLVKKFVNGVLGDFKDEYSDQLKQLRPSLDLLADESKSEKTVTQYFYYLFYYLFNYNFVYLFIFIFFFF